MDIRISRLILPLLLVCSLVFNVADVYGSALLPDEKPTDTVNKARLTGVIAGTGVIYAGSMIGLNSLWYKNYPKSSFHFINDNDEWLQLDKAAHTTASYYIGLVGYEGLRWAGVNEKKAAWYGGSLGFVFLTVIEILDGFSAEWGASTGDLIANGIGTAAFISQQLCWKEQRILMKWSSHLTDYATYRPEILGSSFPERIFKDYNGQTFWLSANIRSFIKKESRFPGWLNIAVGYSGDGMTGSRFNPATNNKGEPIPAFDRRRQFYLAPDIDLTRIKTGSEFLNKSLKFFGFLKVPLPAIEFGKEGVKFHPLYF